MDPALCGHATGDGEQTISKIHTRGEHGRFVFNGAVAQLAERFLCKEEDVGSNPICSTVMFDNYADLMKVVDCWKDNRYGSINSKSN
jgi:hypothetical protein